MEANAETFRTRLIDLRAIETKRTDLMEVSKGFLLSLSVNTLYAKRRLWQELLHRLEKAEAKLQQTELDLQNERDARRRLQQDVFEMKERESTSVIINFTRFVKIPLTSGRDDDRLRWC